eukprot:scaffold174489_cov36-Prasinocladus_malaysianus.AAC.1
MIASFVSDWGCFRRATKYARQGMLSSSDDGTSMSTQEDSTFYHLIIELVEPFCGPAAAQMVLNRMIASWAHSL